MGSSFVRRELRRKCCYVTKIRSTGRWIPRSTVRVVCKGLYGASAGEVVKATEGAEKSCLARRRKRGLRKSKRRSRGGKPRRSVKTATPDSAPVSNRQLSRVCSQMDYWEEWIGRFRKSVKRFARESDWFDSHWTGGSRTRKVLTPNFRYKRYRERWLKILRALSLAETSSKLFYTCSWAHFLNKTTGVSSPGSSVRKALEDWREDYRQELEIIRGGSREWNTDTTQLRDNVSKPSARGKRGSKKQASRSESTSMPGATSSLTRGKPNGKRSRPRLASQVPCCDLAYMGCHRRDCPQGAAF